MRLGHVITRRTKIKILPVVGGVVSAGFPTAEERTLWSKLALETGCGLGRDGQDSAPRFVILPMPLTSTNSRWCASAKNSSDTEQI